MNETGKKLILRILRKEKRNPYIEYVCKETGWTYKQAKEQMEVAREWDISYRYYAKRKLWARTEKELEKVKRDMQIVNARNREEKAHALEMVCKETGWDEETALERIRQARKVCGCTYKDYYKFKLYRYDADKQSTFLTSKVMDEISFKYNHDPKVLKLLLHKERFAKKYDDLLNRKWFVNRKLTFEEFLERMEGVEDLVCKPTSATQGKGIEKIHCGADLSETEKRSLYEKLFSAKKTMICEECIVQHPEMAAFNTSSVNSVRVLTITREGKCYHIYAGFRMGRGKIVDNFHAGGIIATVDVKSGVTCMDAIDLEGKHYPQHPISKLATKGFQIPHWDKVLTVTEEAALRLEGVGLVGWDVAITEKGVCLIEGNSEASYHIIQLPYVEEGIGMKYVFAPFLD